MTDTFAKLSLAILAFGFIGGCLTRPSLERPPTEKALAEPPARNELPSPRIAALPEAEKPPEILTLPDSYRFAIRQSERLERAGEDILQAQLIGRKALALALPKIGIAGKLTRFADAPSFGGARFFPTKRDEYYLELKAPLFSGFQERHAWRQSGALQESRKASLKEFRDELLLDVTEAFYGTLQAQREIAVREDSLKLQEERLREAEARFRAGVIRRTEVLLIQAQVARERSDLVRARQNLEIIRNALGFFIGFLPPERLVDANAAAVSVDDPDALLAEAQQIRQDLRALEKAVEAAKHAVKIEAAEYWPKIRLEGEYYGDRDGSSSNIDWEARMIADLPLFDAGLRRTELRDAYSRFRQAELARDELRRSIGQEVRQAVADLRSSRSLLEALQAQLRPAEESYRRARAEFVQGVATNLEVITAQNLLLQSQIELERERLQERVNEARLRKVLSRPFEEK